MNSCEKEYCLEMECLINNYKNNNIITYMLNTCYGLGIELYSL